jgi:hypothetical protein
VTVNPIATGNDAKSTDVGEQKDHAHRWHLPSVGLLAGLAVLVGLVVLAFHAGSISHQIARVLSHLSVSRLPWLLVAIAAETLSFVCYALVQRNLLGAGGADLPRKVMLSLAVAATGLTNLVPGGTAPSSGWLVAQYRKRGIPTPLALWAVLAGGYAAIVSVLTLTLVGASVAGLLPPLAIGACALLLVAGSVGALAAYHQLDALDRWVHAHQWGRPDRVLRAIGSRVADTTRFRTNRTVGARVLVLSLGNWGLDVACLVAAFGLLGLPVPWRTVLFAYTLSQIAGSLAPVPGGIGFMEGGMIGAFALAGTPLGGAILATILYRLITSLGVAGVGSVVLLKLSRQKSAPQAHLSGRAATLSKR